MKFIRSLLGGVLVLLGIVLTILPGSTILILAGLVLISIDYKYPRAKLRILQKSLGRASRKLDRFLLKRKFR
jgi:hypothetical protein